MKPHSKRIALLLGMALAATGCGKQSAAEPDAQKLAELQTRLAHLKQEIGLARDVSAIKKLQRAYGYYLDKGISDANGDMFARDATAEYSVSGLLIGQDSIRRALHFTGPNNSLVEGRMNTHMQLQGLVNVAPDGQTAKARWRILALTGNYGERASWGEGPYEVEYVKEDGVWKIKKLQWYVTVTGAMYEGGWTKERPPVQRRPGSIPPPDAPSTVPDLKPYPAVYMPPYHYKNPVTGR
jgi:hypothetical protein